MTDQPDKRAQRIALFLVAGLAALIAGLLTAGVLIQMRADSAAPLSGTWLSGGKTVGEFNLVDHAGQPFDQRRLQGKWTYLFVGYTHCPDACPTAMAALAGTYQRIRQQAPQAPVQTVFVSVDPARDTPERLAQYVPFFEPSFLGVTGSEEELAAFTGDLGLVYRRHAPEPGRSDYLVDHSTMILLLNPRGQLQAVFSPPHSPQAMAEDFLKILERYRA